MGTKRPRTGLVGRRTAGVRDRWDRIAGGLVAAWALLGAPAACDLAGTPPDDDVDAAPVLTFPCGDDGVRCTIGFVCVISDVSVSRQQPQFLFECRGDPCRPEELTCLCAATLCDRGQTCIREDERTILCREE